jgi:prolyl-tRNA editing enzyme YbaK/EbsC (Cys-tRNA(Pro) deacylase)
MLTSQDLQKFIDQNQIAAEIMPMEEDTPTVPDAARALGVEEDQIIKSLVFVVDDQPTLVITNGTHKVDSRLVALVITNGTHKVDSRLVARHYGVGRKRAKMTRAEQALEITGYAVGAMPPFGHRTRLRTIVDPGVVDQQEIFGGGGEIDAMLRLASEELLRVTGARIVRVT